MNHGLFNNCISFGFPLKDVNLEIIFVKLSFDRQSDLSTMTLDMQLAYFTLIEEDLN